MKPRRKLIAIILLVIGFAAGYWLVQVGIVANSFARAGFFEEQQKRSYDNVDAENQLKDLHAALTLYLDSEGALPPANAWMDAIKPRLKTADLSETEALKKLQAPGNRGKTDAFGIVFNPALGGKAWEDVPPKTPVLFYSDTLTQLNANASPDAATNVLAITADGTVLILGESPSQNAPTPAP